MVRMNEEQPIEAGALLSRLEAAYQHFEGNHTTPVLDAETLTNLTRAAAFGDQDAKKRIDAIMHPEPDIINVTVSPKELLTLIQGLILQGQNLIAEQYIKDSLGKNVTSTQRWSTVAEIMLLKTPGENISRRDSDRFCCYWAMIKSGLKPRAASEEVFKQFKFDNQEACDQWLSREINRRKKESEIYKDIPAPSTWPRI